MVVTLGLSLGLLTSTLFSVVLVAVVLIVGALTFFPAYALGPVLEQFLMNAGRLF